jgi:hypothetical protein
MRNDESAALLDPFAAVFSQSGEDWSRTGKPASHEGPALRGSGSRLPSQNDVDAAGTSASRADAVADPATGARRQRDALSLSGQRLDASASSDEDGDAALRSTARADTRRGAAWSEHDETGYYAYATAQAESLRDARAAVVPVSDSIPGDTMRMGGRNGGSADSQPAGFRPDGDIAPGEGLPLIWDVDHASTPDDSLSVRAFAGDLAPPASMLHFADLSRIFIMLCFFCYLC